MKKWLVLLLTGLLVFSLGACSSQTDTEEKEESTENSEDANKEEDAKKVRSALLAYQGSVTKLIRATESGLVAEGADPLSVAEQFGTDVDGVAIPAELSDHSADLEAGVASLKEYYTKKAELLQAKAEDLSELDPIKQGYVDSVTKVFDAVELSPPVFSTLF